MDRQTQNQIQKEGSDSPGFSHISMRSDRSMSFLPLWFKGEHKSPELSESPEASVSVYVTDQPARDSVTYEQTSVRLRSRLMEKFSCVHEGTKRGNPTLLSEIYTDLYITECERDISHEHEFRQIEIQSRSSGTEETAIRCCDIFKLLPEQDKAIRTVLTKGVAGIGKTVSVQKLIVDWAKGKENQDVQLVFPLPFRDLNLIKDKQISLLQLLEVFFPETAGMKISNGGSKILFIFDGLDECRLSLDFHGGVRLFDVSESTSLDVLLMNLIKGNLLPSALIWITARPAAADLIPRDCVHRVTEVRGFSDSQKEEYFRKRIRDQSLSQRIISHMKLSRSLYIMCHIPVFCWISAAVLERMMRESESRENPKTLTQMYTHFLILQINITHEKDYEKNVKNEEMLLKLGKLAFQQLVKRNVVFYEEDLMECDVGVTEATVYSGLCTKIFREESSWFQGKVFCFVHLSIQEHLAALYVHLTFTNSNISVFHQSNMSFNTSFNQLDVKSLSDVHISAVTEALESVNGHLNLFLRFLLGLSLASNQSLLQGTLLQTSSFSYSKEETVQFIIQKIREIQSPEKSINLFHCLNELGNDSLTQEIQHYLTSGEIERIRLSSSQWSALVFVLLTSEQKLEVFKLYQFIGAETTADKVLQKLLPVIKESTSVDLSDCGVTEDVCSALTSALRSNPRLTELDLSGNNLRDSGVKTLCDLLKDPNSKLQKLGLRWCGMTEEGCSALTSALRSNPHLTELDLSNNNLRDSAVKILWELLKDPNTKLEKLSLRGCEVTEEVCSALTSALRSNSRLTELDLSNNSLRDSGMKILCDSLKESHSKLQRLSLRCCEVTEEGCSALTSALRSNSRLTDLDLSGNNLRDPGVKVLCDSLKDFRCKLQKLSLSRCGVTEEGCSALTSALRSNSCLTDLDLSGNNLRDSGALILFDLLKDPNGKLQKLRLRWCGVTEEICSALTSALRSNPRLTELDLSYNNLRDSAVKIL